MFTSGDSAWKDGKDYQDLPNLSNIMGKMEYGKMIAGVAAALTTQTGKIGYLGPLINDETRRLASSVYLGAKYAWTKYLKKDPADLKFTVNWIGFWFNIPGVTSDPTQVADNFFNRAMTWSSPASTPPKRWSKPASWPPAGKKVWAIPYDFAGALDEAPDRRPRRALLQLGPGLPQGRHRGQPGQVDQLLGVERPRLDRHQQPRHLRRGLQQGRRPLRRRLRQGRRVHQSWPAA